MVETTQFMSVVIRSQVKLSNPYMLKYKNCSVEMVKCTLNLIRENIFNLF